MRDVWTSIADIAVHLAHHTDMLVTVEQRVLVVLGAITPTNSMRRLVGLEACIGQDYDQALGVLVTAGNRYVLLGDQLREAGRRQRLCLRACEAGEDLDVSHGKAFVEKRCGAAGVCDEGSEVVERERQQQGEEGWVMCGPTPRSCGAMVASETGGRRQSKAMAEVQRSGSFFLNRP